nr:MAG TPA: hypothetical protein [Caudoviricetes sp.]
MRGCGCGLVWDGFGASALVALAACDAGVVESVLPASCGWHHVVRLWAAWLECGSPCEWLSAVWAVRLSVGLCEVEDADAPALVACCAGAGGAGSWGHGTRIARRAYLARPRCAGLVVCAGPRGGVNVSSRLAFCFCYSGVSTFVGVL